MPILGFGVWRVPGAAATAPVKAALAAGYRSAGPEIVAGMPADAHDEQAHRQRNHVSQRGGTRPSREGV